MIGIHSTGIQSSYRYRLRFKDCNVDRLERSEERGLYARDDFYRPPEEGRIEFENRLAQALAARKAKGE